MAVAAHMASLSPGVAGASCTSGVGRASSASPPPGRVAPPFAGACSSRIAAAVPCPAGGAYVRQASPGSPQPRWASVSASPWAAPRRAPSPLVATVASPVLAQRLPVRRSVSPIAAPVLAMPQRSSVPSPRAGSPVAVLAPAFPGAGPAAPMRTVCSLSAAARGAVAARSVQRRTVVAPPAAALLPTPALSAVAPRLPPSSMDPRPSAVDLALSNAEEDAQRWARLRRMTEAAEPPECAAPSKGADAEAAGPGDPAPPDELRDVTVPCPGAEEEEDPGVQMFYIGSMRTVPLSNSLGSSAGRPAEDAIIEEERQEAPRSRELHTRLNTSVSLASTGTDTRQSSVSAWAAGSANGVVEADPGAALGTAPASPSRQDRSPSSMRRVQLAEQAEVSTYRVATSSPGMSQAPAPATAGFEAARAEAQDRLARRARSARASEDGGRGAPARPSRSEASGRRMVPGPSCCTADPYEGLLFTPITDRPFQAISSIARQAQLTLLERLTPRGSRPAHICAFGLDDGRAASGPSLKQLDA